MPFVKNTSYRDMPFSHESPSPEDIYRFVTLRQLKELRYDPRVYRFRTIGVLAWKYGRFVVHELDDANVQVRLCLSRWARGPPYEGMPYATQIAGLVYWDIRQGPVLEPVYIQSLTPQTAFHLRNSMTCLSQVHVARAVNPEDVRIAE